MLKWASNSTVVEMIMRIQIWLAIFLEKCERMKGLTDDATVKLACESN